MFLKKFLYKSMGCSLHHYVVMLKKKKNNTPDLVLKDVYKSSVFKKNRIQRICVYRNKLF